MTLRLLATGDDHFVLHTRFDDCVKVHAWMVELARDLKIDAFLDGGDVFDEASEPEEREAVADFVISMSEIARQLYARGNHDQELELAFLRRLRTKHPVVVEERAGVHIIGGFAVAAIAWPERANILAMAGSIGGTDELIREALRTVFLGLGGQLEAMAGPNVPRIGLGHLMIDGSIASTGQPLIGMPINVGLADLALIGADLGLASHIHKAQSFQPPSGGPWEYAGASHRTDYGQTEPKSVLFAEFEGRRLVKLERIPTPCAPMSHVEGSWEPELGGLLVNSDVDGAYVGHEIRLRYKVPAAQQEAADAAAREWRDRLIAAGAKDVKTEAVVVVETRARAPEVSAALSFPAKLEAHWESVKFDPGSRRQPMLEKAAWLEQQKQVRDAA